MKIIIRVDWHEEFISEMTIRFTAFYDKSTLKRQGHEFISYLEVSDYTNNHRKHTTIIYKFIVVHLGRYITIKSV
jgi:phosphatidate phosphatase PAH1